MQNDFDRTTFHKGGFTVPVEERIRYYYTLGYPAEDIAQLVSEEFDEFEVNEIGEIEIKKFIGKHSKSLMAAKQEFALRTRQEYELKLKDNFRLAQFTECSIVETYCKKIKGLIKELEELDVSEKDEDGYFVNMGSYATLVMAINRTHETIEKLSGTLATREVLVYMQKARAKEAAAKKDGLHDAVQEMEVKFMDEGVVAGELPELR